MRGAPLQSPSNATRVSRDPASVADRLRELGLNEQLLRTAVDYGIKLSADCTLHDPPSLSGILAWGKITRGLRDQLVPQGWTTSNAQNYASTIHPRGAAALVVAAGDAFTGLEERTPSTRSDKGPATRDAVDANQASFAEVDPSYPWPAPPVRPTQTWLLLHHMDDESGTVRIELSLPADISAEGFITAWRERLILEPLPVVPNPSLLTDSQGDEGELEIRIERRA
jgi:hypothetical protein